MKYIKNTAGIELEKKAIFSTDDNDIYYFFMPIVSKLWVKMGYQPNVFVVGNEKHWLETSQKQLVLNTSLANGADVVILDSEMIKKTREFDGYNLSALAQISRLCSPCWPNVKDSDYFLTSDIDMLPLKKPWFHQQDLSKPVHIFYSNNYNHTRYSICYIGMNVNTWKKAIDIERQNIYVQLMKIILELKRNSPQDEQWGHDEIFLFRRIKNFPGYPQTCHMIDRKTYKNPVVSGNGGGGPLPGTIPFDRLDRSNWIFKGNIETYVDAHCKRPGYQSANWTDIRFLLGHVFDQNELMWADEYYKEFIK
jgi:hypothetical protein